MFRLIGKLISKLFKLFFGFILLIVIAGILLPNSSNKEKHSNNKETDIVRSVNNKADRQTEKETRTISTEETESEAETECKGAEEETENEGRPTTEQTEKRKASLAETKAEDSDANISSETETKITRKELKISEETKQGTEEPVVEETPAFDEIRRGDKNDSVKEIQSILFTLGFLASSPDGAFGPKTEQAVIDFQKAAGIESSGIIDQATYTVLISDNAPEKETEIKNDESREPSLSDSNTTRMYASANVNVRSGPSADTERLGTISQGDAVQAGKAENGWAPIIYGSGIGYVSSKYLSSSAPILALTPETSASASNDIKRSTSEQMVWIPTHGGKKFHSKSSCSNMKGPVEVTRSEAEAMGFEPCGRCRP